MLRMMLEYVEPGMKLARDIYNVDGRTILAAGATITERHLDVLKKWGVMSVYIHNPLIDLPPVDEVLAESARLKASSTIRETFLKVEQKGLYQISREQRAIVDAVIEAVFNKRLSIIHLAQIHRHHDNLFVHSINVSVLATMTAVAYGINNMQDLISLALGSVLHDIGMIAFPKNMATKSGLMNADEFAVFQTHTSLGFELLRKSQELPLTACHIALQHHEKFNGKGFPRGLAGSDIHLLSRIVSIANDYENLVADQPGKPAIAPHHAYERIVAEVNVSYDPDIAKAFLSRIALYPIGTLVRLTSGSIGIVADVTSKAQHRPIVKVLAEAEGSLLPNPYILDLTAQDNLTVFIDEVVSDAVAVNFLKKNVSTPPDE